MTRLDVNGDDVFSFTSERFSYRIARQNRPPALDYVGQKACPVKYDYLVIKEDFTLDKVDIILNAVDPDEEEKDIVYSFEKLPQGWDKFVSNDRVLKVETKDLTEPSYTITAKATDEHGLADWQEVRIVVDEPLDSEISFNLPYMIPDGSGGLIDYKTYSQNLGTYKISPEDPLFLEFRYPSQNLVGKSVSATITKTSGGVDTVIPQTNVINNPATPNLFCITSGTSCDIKTYNMNNNLPPLNYVTGDKLKLDVDVNFCGGYEDPQQKELKVDVVQCIPHRNVEYPFAFPYNEWKKEASGFKLDSGNGVAPYLANHSCCNDDFTLKLPNDEPCFINPGKTCGGNVNNNPPGYLLEEEYAVCDGKQGNKCGSTIQRRLVKDVNGKVICPDPKIYPTCKEVASSCVGKEQYHLEQKQGGFWCDGLLGCGESKVACESEIVYTKTVTPNKFQYPLNAGDVAGEYHNFQCGCTDTDVAKGQTSANTCYNFADGKPGICKQVGNSFICST